MDPVCRDPDDDRRLDRFLRGSDRSDPEAVLRLYPEPDHRVQRDDLGLAHAHLGNRALPRGTCTLEWCGLGALADGCRVEHQHPRSTCVLGLERLAALDAYRDCAQY